MRLKWRGDGGRAGVRTGGEAVLLKRGSGNCLVMQDALAVAVTVIYCDNDRDSQPPSFLVSALYS